jgi:glucokinase
MSSTKKFAIGIDLGATKIASALIAKNGQVMASSQAFTRAREGVDAVVGRIVEQIEALRCQASGEVVGIGIGSPGKVDSVNGIVYDAVNLGWAKANLTEEISRRMEYPLPIWIQKDANLSALGELYFGAGKNYADFMYIGIGSGLGGGIICDGQLIAGGNGYAAELGHLSLDPDGPLCACGQRGCAELIASGPGLVRIMNEKFAKVSSEKPPGKKPPGKKPPGKKPPQDEREWTSVEIISAAKNGHWIACDALSEVGRALGVVMSACAAILNPSCFVIGGGLGVAGFDFLVPAIREELTQRTTLNSRKHLNIVPSSLESPAIGAACLVWYAFLNIKGGDA